jgi:prepilin signal peptidase PulO-like enzyme (type II secretory pathway)
MIIYLIFVFVIGLIVGSFLNVVILRLPAEESMGGRSHCNHCKHELSALDLVPLFSYVLLRGKCRYCKQDFSPRYFIIELVTAMLFAFAFGYANPSDLVSWLTFVRMAFISAALVVFFMIDLEHYLILDKVVLFSSVVLLGLNLALDYFANTSLTLHGLLAGLALAAFFGLIYAWSRGSWIGMGDIKFALFLGLATPGLMLAFNIFIASLLGSILGVLLLAGGSNLKTKLPFGTFLALSCIITMYYGEVLVRWYFALLGLSV